MPEMSLDSAAGDEFSHAGGDVFDFKAMEESEAAGSQVGTVKTFICPADVVWLNGDGRDDLAIGGDDATQSGDDADINIGVGELQECTISKSNDGVAVDDLIVNAVISEADYAGGDAGTKGSGLPNVQVRDLQLDQNFDVMAGTALPSVTDLILDPYNPKAGEVGDMDSFVFEDSTSGAGLRPMGWDILKNNAFNGSEPDPSGRLLVGTDGGIWSDGDGKDALAMYQPATVDIDLSLLAVDTGGIPVSLPEYAVMLI